MKIISGFCLVAVFFLTSCSNDMFYDTEFTESQIYGFWTDTVETSSKAKSVNSLIFRANGSFVAKSEGYGSFPGQESVDLSYSIEDQGNYVLSARDIYFVSKKRIEWDFQINKNPVSTELDKVLFESCTYEIKNDTLTMSYIDYPADAPKRLTVRKYKRVEV